MIRLMACGDLTLYDRVESSWKERGVGGILSDDLFALLKSADLFLANIECPLTDSPHPAWTHFPTLKASAEASKVLSALGVSVAALANNHIADYGRDGLADTLRLLQDSGIPTVGAGWTPAEASKPLVIEKGGLKIGFLALAQPEISAATEKRKWGAGVLEETAAVEAMRRLTSCVDISIAYLHFGVEFYEYPTPSQIRLARSLVDAGAKLVLGHHPHVPQGWEWYKGAFIAYSLGNFLFDMRPVREAGLRIGLLVDTTFEGTSLKNVNLIPVETANGFTRFLQFDERNRADAYLENLCNVLSDESRLQKEYYFTCRGNLRIHLQAFLYYIRKAEWQRAADLIPMQAWPQLFELRKDLFQFLVSGKFIQYERKKH